MTPDAAAPPQGFLEEGQLNPPVTNLVEGFAASVRRHKDRPAISGAHWRPTYEELDRSTDQLAEQMRTRLPDKEAPAHIAVLMEHDSPLVAACVAAVKSGHTAAVLDQAASPEELLDTMERISAVLLVYSPHFVELAGKVESLGIPALSSDALFSPQGATVGVTSAILPSQPAHLVSTSGTSGTRKLILQTHGQILQTTSHFSSQLGFQATDRFLLISQLSWGQGVATMWSALLNGACLCPFDLRKRGMNALAPWIEKKRISVFVSAVGIFRSLLARHPEPAQLRSVRLVRVGAEAATSADFREFLKWFPDTCRFASSYTSSESGSIALLVLDRHDNPASGPLPGGILNPAMDLQLFDDEGNPVAQGETGHLVIRTPHPAAGYWGQPALTAERFRPDPTNPRFCCYHTGDLAWLSDSGILHLAGRADAQVKISGKVLNLAVLEDAVRECKGVAGAMACKGTLAHGAAVILTGVVLEPDPPTDVLPRARAALDKALGDLKVARHVLLLQELPLSPNGKPDRKELARLLAARLPTTATPPRTEMEQIIAQAWNAALGVERGVPRPLYETFFQAGGDSMQAVDLLASLSKELGRDLSMLMLLNHPTIAQLAEAIEAGYDAPPTSRPRPVFAKSTLLPLRLDGERTPLLVVPGGYASENELAVFARLLEAMPAGHPCHGTRLNLIAPRVWGPWSLRRLARQTVRQWHATGSRYGKPPLVIGECQGCPLAYEIACRIPGASLVLLDPRQPRPDDSPAKPSPPGTMHPPAIARYYKLTRSFRPTHRLRGNLTLVSCEFNSASAMMKLDWWKRKSSPAHACQVVITPGDHETYLRDHRIKLAELLGRICDLPA